MSITDGIKNSSVEAVEDKYKEYRDHQTISALPQSVIYDIIIDQVYPENKMENPNSSKFAWPVGFWKRVIFIINLPLVATQYISIPSPIVDGKESCYPLSLLMATIWVWAYSYFIMWFTFELTIAFNLRFSIIPMLIFPFGIALRDYKKYVDMEKMLVVFATKPELKGQRLSLAETFSGPIFQMTGMMGAAWLLYMQIKGGNVTFINESI